MQTKKQDSGLPEGHRSGTAVLYGPVLRALYEAVLISDMDGQVVEANPRAERSLGRTRDVLRGCSLPDLVAGFGPEVLAGVVQNLAEGRFTVLDAFCLRADGSRFPAEIAISRLRGETGERLVCSVRNMEWRERTLDRLRTGYNALHNAAAGLVITDDEARIRYANPAFARLWGEPEGADAWVGRDLSALWADAGAAGTMVAEAASGRIWGGELEGARKNGVRFFVQATAAQNRTADEAPAGLVFSFIDISDRKRAEEAIRREAEAQMHRAREQDDFSGLLNILSIPDVVQLIDASQKSGWLAILGENTKEIGKIGFVDGQVVTAHAGERRGANAFYDILRIGGHAFLFQQGTPDERDDRIGESTMGLLLEGSRRMDEAADLTGTEFREAASGQER